MSRTSANAGNAYIEWGPVIAGAFIALAITAILIPFGNSIGLSITGRLDGDDIRGMVFGVSLWVLWTQLISSIIGGYIAGKTLNARSGTAFESEFRDGAHGLLSWAVATVLTAIGVAAAGFFASVSPEAAEAAREASVSTDTARRTAVVLGYTVAASSLIAAIAAWVMATLGGDHRDNEADFSNFFSFRAKQKRSRK